MQTEVITYSDREILTEKYVFTNRISFKHVVNQTIFYFKKPSNLESRQVYENTNYLILTEQHNVTKTECQNMVKNKFNRI